MLYILKVHVYSVRVWPLDMHCMYAGPSLRDITSVMLCYMISLTIDTSNCNRKSQYTLKHATRTEYV